MTKVSGQDSSSSVCQYNPAQQGEPSGLGDLPKRPETNILETPASAVGHANTGASAIQVQVPSGVRPPTSRGALKSRSVHIGQAPTQHDRPIDAAFNEAMKDRESWVYVNKDNGTALIKKGNLKEGSKGRDFQLSKNAFFLKLGDTRATQLNLKIGIKFEQKGWGYLATNADGSKVPLVEVSYDEAHCLLAQVDFEKAPLNYEPQQVGKLPDGRVLYVDKLEYDYTAPYDIEKAKSRNPENFRVFLGMPGDMKELKVKSGDTYRDGGTIFIDTEEGKYRSPAFRREDSTFTPTGGTPIKVPMVDRDGQRNADAVAKYYEYVDSLGISYGDPGLRPHF